MDLWWLMRISPRIRIIPTHRRKFKAVFFLFRCTFWVPPAKPIYKRGKPTMNVDHLPGKPMVSLVYHYRWVPFQFRLINEHCGSFHGTLCQTATVFEQGVWDWPRGCWRIELATSDCLEMAATFFGRDKSWHTHSRCDADDSAHSANRAHGAHGANRQYAPQSHHELEGLRQLSIPPGSHGCAGTSSSAKIWAVEWWSRGSREHTERYHSSSFDDKPLLL